MCCFILPKGLIKDLHRMIADFWWGSTEDNRKTHWGKWDKMCSRKEEGGLGFRNLESFNQALLAKSVWRILRSPSSLAARVLKASYFPGSDLLSTTNMNNASSVWRGLMWGRGFIIKGSRWRIGSGAAVDARTGRWIPRTVGFTVSEPDRIPSGMTVADFKNSAGRWNIPLLRECLTAEEVDEVLKIPCTTTVIPDELCWHFTNDGEYAVRSGYRVAREAAGGASSSNPGISWKWWGGGGGGFGGLKSLPKCVHSYGGPGSSGCLL
jgi:hypothetical protein